MASTTAPPEPERSVEQGWVTSVSDIARRLGPDFARAATRQRALTERRGQRSLAARQHRWQLAEATGDAPPDGCPYVMARADGAADAVRDAWRVYIRPPRRDAHGVLVLDETGLLKEGRHAAGVARPSRGTAGKVETCQMGVLVASASRLGHALGAGERYLPGEWPPDRERCRAAGVPEDRDLATTPELAPPLLARAFAAGRPAPGVTGDSVYGHARQLWRWLDGRPRQVQPLVAALPPEGWTRLSAGDGTQGPRWAAWRWRPLAAERARESTPALAPRPGRAADRDPDPRLVPLCPRARSPGSRSEQHPRPR